MLALTLLCTIAGSRSAAAADESVPCDAEPTDQMIAYGDELYGPDCFFDPIGDSDFFRFQGSAGEVVRVILSDLTGSLGANACMEIFAPDSSSLVVACDPLVDLSLTQNGLYTILVFEQANNQSGDYSLSINRISPISPDAVALFFGDVREEMVGPPTDQDHFWFSGTAGQGVRITLIDLSGSLGSNTCMDVFDPAAVSVASTCETTLDVVPAVDGNYLILVTEQAYNQSGNYNIGLQCLGVCEAPSCVLEMDMGYDSGLQRLTINWQVLTDQPVDWNTWFTYLNQSIQLWSAPIPVINPAVSGPVSFTLPPLGTVGVLSTFSMPGAGIVCSDFETVNTGMPSLAAPATQAEIESNLPTSPGIGGNPGHGRGNGRGPR